MSNTIIDCRKGAHIPSNVFPIEKYKCVLLGDAGTGKTSIITRFINDHFEQTYQSTIGIDFLSKTYTYKNRSVRLQLWDTAGQERFRSLIPSYIRDSSIAIIVYDISSKSSFTNVRLWYDDVKKQREDIITILVGNKSDLEEKREVSVSDGESLAKELNTICIETSAKCGYNITTIFQQLITLLPKEIVLPMDERQKYIKVNINPASLDTRSDSCMC